MTGPFARVRSLWRGLRSGSRLRSEMDEEFRYHMELRAADLVRSGVPAAHALRQARIEFGSVERYKEEGRDVRGLAFFDQLSGDLRYAFRSLRRNPVFTVVAVVTLALGIGANTAIFSVIHHTLLRPLPFDSPDRIVTLWERGTTGGRNTVAEENLRDWRAQTRSFEAMAYHGNPEFGGRHTVLGAGEPIRVRINDVSEDFFSVFGVRPLMGRLLLPDEHRPGGPAVALISHDFWRSRLGADPAVLGRTLDVLGEGFEIIGVLPAGFHYPAQTEIWLSKPRWGINPNRSAKNNVAVGRLRDGVDIDAAQAELDRLGAAMSAEHGETSGAAGAIATPVREELVGDMRQPLLLLFGAAALLLLIACTNLASTLLARGAARHREVAIRSALGAARARIVGQLLTESLLLALLGGIAGIALALQLLRALDAVRPAALQSVAGASVNGPVLAFTLVLTVITAVLFGLLPALRITGTSVGGSLRSGSRGNADTGSSRVWGALVGVEVALAVVLLIGAGLLIRSFAGVLGQPVGFDPRQVLTAEISLPASRYADDAAMASYYDRLLTEVGAVRGIERAGLIQHVPLGGISWNGSFDIEGRGESTVYAGYRVVSPGYFEAMGIPLLRGRDFAPSDDMASPHVVIINRRLAEAEWPGEDPIGRRIGNLANEPDRYRGEGQWLTIVGVAADVRQGGLLADAEPEVYVNVMQHPARARNTVLTMRTSVAPASVVDPVRARVRALDPQVPVEFATMSQRVMASVADRRFNVFVLGLFAGVALLLAGVGIYGVVSYSVARRTREIGIRLALGATPANVRRMMQRRTMSAVLLGAAAGAVGAIGLARLIQGLLWGVGPGDPLTFAAATVILIAVAWLATYIPARRSTGVDPLVTMRAE